MDKLLIRILCVSSFLVLIHSVQHETDDFADTVAYDLNRLARKTSRNLQNSLHLKDFDPLDSLKFDSNNKDITAEFQPTGYLLKNSSKCLGDIMHTVLNLKSQWALKLIDSFGKPESGILEGNAKWVGDYDECLGVRSTNPNSTIGNFRGKYCFLTWTLSVYNMSMPFTTSMCIPDSCSAEELRDDALQLLHIAGAVLHLNNTGSVQNTTSFQCKATERPLNSPAKAVIAVLSIFCALTVFGSSITAVKYFRKIIHEARSQSKLEIIPESYPAIGDESNHVLHRNIESDNKALLPDGGSESIKNEWLQKMETFFGCFCVFKNGSKILNTDSSEGELLCIHGIRFLSMSWVILGHTYVFGFAEIRNILGIVDLVNNFAFQAILEAFYSVDSFFVLSGFLLTYLSMKEFSKTKGSISWPYFYIHRYLRLTPMYMILLGVSASVYFYIGSGPYWSDVFLDQNCKENWWKNLIYINNFGTQALQCMGWSWYLANDMQFFIISPIFLITLWRWPKVGYSFLAAFWIASCLSNFFITYHFNLPVGIIAFINSPTLDYTEAMVRFADYFDKLYTKPYTRIAPYLIGMLAGYLLFKNKASNRPKHSLAFLCIGWILASAITLTSVYGLYKRTPNLLASSFFNALNRTCFAVGLSWVIYICLVGQGGFINKILSYKLFIPLSRLTYAAYLIHPMIIMAYFGSLKTSMVFSHSTIVILFLGFMVVTYGLALPVALMLESPIVSLEKLIRKKLTEEQRPGTVN